MSNRPQITVKTGKVAGNPAILIIPDGDINATQIMGFPELIEQLEDLGVVLADSGLIENANTVRSLLGLLQISKL